MTGPIDWIHMAHPYWPIALSYYNHVGYTKNYNLNPWFYKVL